MTLPAAGFFPDPQDTRRLRWWDGRTWGSATQPAPSAARSSAPGQGEAHETHAEPQFSVRPAAVATAAWACGTGVAASTAVNTGASIVAGQTSGVRRFCLFGWGSLVVALLSAVVNPIGMFSVLAVLLAVVGIARPNGTGSWRIVGRSIAVSALVLAVTTGLVFMTAFGHLLHQYAGI
ncbi:DUF2510 domain-containing protein [Curtobacterium sp. Leaf261]|uniref:DUF2510 domain-containing protein n=1 Tax=Curtobacterium sp. Leaf261 TaxID=1736311 RepID=UPI0006F97A47|nr:DUF2510 domain-containing protein [Curtobacterium sp. Leaf261]KQO62659.1 hypothetical protein ASF23_06730 [Curtobacterium sp. Leaf261]